MSFSFVFRMIFLLSVIVSFAAGDFEEPLTNGVFSVSDPPLDLDSSLLPSDEIASAPSLSMLPGAESFPANGPDLSLWDQVSSDLGLNEPFQLAACSVSDDFTTVGQISRLRRSQNPKSCSSPATGVGNPAGDPDDLEYGDPGDAARLLNDLLDPANSGTLDRAIEKQQGDNMFCDVLTNGELPNGVCSSADPGDVASHWNFLPPSGMRTFGVPFKYTVNHCTLGMSTKYRATVALTLT